MPPEPPPPAPVPVSATYGVAGTVLTVTFDQLLQPGVSAFMNWFFTRPAPAQNRQFNAPGADIAGFTVSKRTNAVGIGGIDPTTVAYDAAPPDVFSLASGVPAAAFAGFPVTILP